MNKNTHPPSPVTCQTVLEAAVAAQRDFCGTLLVLPAALAAAADSPFRRPTLVHDAFRALHAVCLRRRAALKKGLSMGALYDAFLQEGFHYTPHESVTTLGRWAAERTVIYRGKKILAQAHLALGKGGPESCLRIHFFTDEMTPDFLFVVAHCGRHLTNSRT